MKSRLFKVKDGKLYQWKNWCTLLETEYESEALKSLEEEGLTYEACDLYEKDTHYYVKAFWEGEGKESNKNKEVNVLHNKNKKECLEPSEEQDVTNFVCNLYNFQL